MNDKQSVSIAYSGVCEDAGGRRTLANKVSFAGFEEARTFRSHTEGVVADFYAVSSVKRRVFNSDGSLWLQRSMVPDCTYQLDLFHRNKAVRTYLNDPELQKLVLKLLRERKPKEAIAVVEASIESTLDPAEQENRRRLFSYFSNHSHALIPYYQRAGRQPPLREHGEQYLYHYWEPDEAQPHLLECGWSKQSDSSACAASYRQTPACSARLGGAQKTGGQRFDRDAAALCREGQQAG